jgi:integrase
VTSRRVFPQSNSRRNGHDELERKPKGEGSLFKSNGYWIYSYGYTVDGRQRKRKKRLGTVEQLPTEGAAWKEALKARSKLISAIATETVMTSAVENVTCGELLTQYIEYLKHKKKPSAYVIERCIAANIGPFFGPKKVAKLESQHFEQYRKMRLTKDGVCNATVDHDFTYLKSALMLEYKKTPSRVLKVPYIAKSGEDNVRHGFLELDGYDRLLAELPLSLKCIFVLGYHIGNRKGALLDLKWSQIDFENKVIRFVKMQNRKPVAIAVTWSPG